MVDFRPFNGVRYDESAGSLADLICPPYDVISPEQQRELLTGNSNNMVRLELSELTGPPPSDRYSSAGRSYERMREEGVLRQDESRSYYLLRQRFTSGGESYERLGLLGALRLEELGGAVLPHEDTAAGPKEDRLALMEASSANFSPIMMLYRDTLGQVRRVIAQTTAAPADADFIVDGQGYSIWTISDPALVGSIREALKSQPAYIADGHHRYETALAYERTHPQADTVLTCLIAFDDPGLLIQPYYRVVHGLDDRQLGEMRNLMATLFTPSPSGVTSPDELDTVVANVAQDQVALGIVEPGKPSVILTPSDDTVPAPDAGGAPDEQARAVEANVLQELLFRPVLGDSFPDYVAYVHDPADAIRMVDEGEGQIAFFIKGVPAAAFEAVVGAGIRLPRKSTYFHPKLPSGLVINPLS